MLVPYRWLHERGRGVREVVVATVGGVAFGLMAAAPADADPAPPPTGPDTGAQQPQPAADSTVQRPDAVSAMVTAQAQGVPVEDVSQRTETTRTFANPDGTWSTDMASGPVRVQQPDGSWVDIDTTLEQTASGEWAPRATAAEVSFSDGGTEPFATMAPTQGGSMGLAWPEPLPEPVVSGSTLTYSDAVPNGDLVVQALPGGFSHEIVLHQAPTEPVDYQIPLQLDGLQMVEEASGTLSVRTSAGKEVASAPEPLAWDREDGPDGEADAVAPMDTTVDSTGADAQMVLTPDMQMLQDPDTQFPVTLDPTFSKTPFRDVWVQNADFTSGQVGSPELRAGTYDAGGHKARSFVDFDTDTLTGKHILSATLKARNFYSGSCANGAIRANAVSESWNKDTLTWANQPGVYPGNYDDYANAYGYTGCPDAGWAQWNVIEMVKRWTNGTWTNRGIRLKAVDETSNATWRKYRSANYTTTTSYRPHLVVDYNSYPNTPSVPSVSPVAGSTSTGLVTKSTTPTLSAKVTDPDGGKVRGFFEVRNAAGTLVWSGQSGLVSSGSTASVSVPTGQLGNGTTYTVKAFADDDTNRSKTASSTAVKVDTQAPATPTVTATEHTDGGWRDQRPASNTFTFASTAADVTSLSYSQDNGAWVTKSANSSGEASLAWNPADGAHSLRVKAIDKAGNTSAVKAFTFGVGGADLAMPENEERSTSTFDIDATAPGGAARARLEWRLAGDPNATWTPAGQVTHADTGQPWLGEVTSSDGASRAEDLVWDASTEPSVPSPGLLQLQVCFEYTTGQDKCSTAREVHTVPHAFGSTFPTSELGEGEVALFTGELQVSATDVEVPADTSTLTLGRSHLSLSGRAGSPAAAVFGPGWTADLAGPATGAAGFTVLDRTAEDGSITLQAPWGESFVYQHTSGTRGAQQTGAYVGVGETATYDDTLTLTAGGTGTATHTLTLTEADGTITAWERTAGEWQLTQVEGPQQHGTTRYAYNGDGLVSWMFAPAPAGVTCTTATQQPGCRALNLSYTTVNGASRLASVDLVTYNPQPGADGSPTAAAGMSRTTVARYDYTPDGLLAAAWDPRLGDGTQALKTTYTYNQTGSRTQLATVTPPGEATWTYSYDTSGRVTSVQRPQPGGTGTSTWTVGYDLPTSGPGLPDLTAAATAAWGQNETDAPLAGAAVWEPDHVPAATPVPEDYAYADLAYYSAAGRTTNTAGYGAGAWQIDTTWYDDHGNPTQSLTPANRNRALATAEPATVTEELSTIITYNAAGTRVEDEWGPTREILLEDGSTIVGRDHTSYLYDGETTDPELLAGRPSGAPAEGYDLVVEEEHAVSDADRTTDYDREAIRYGYAPVAPEDGNGWTLRTPTTVRTQMEDGSWSVETTRYDPAGRLIETRQPGGKADASGHGTDPKSYRIDYYTADASATDPACDNQPQWAGLPCTAGPAAQPSTGKPLPTAHTVGYDYLLSPTRVEERSAEVTRTTITNLDAAGRLTRTSVQVANAPAGDQPIPDKTYAYDPGTGLPTTQQAGNDRIEVAYDSWAQPTRYATSTGDQVTNTATATYDAVGRLKTFNDGKGTYTYTYDGTDAQGRTERRGLLTSVDVGLATGPDTFTAAYDGDGTIQQMGYPNNTVARWDYNSIGDLTGLTYSRTGEQLLGFSAAVDAFGRPRAASGPASEQTYRYDNLDRLTRVEDTQNGTCTTRDYQLDADSNRTALTTFPSGSGGACSTTTTGDTRTSTFDEADRITDPGYTYDDLGRTRTVPATDTNAPSAGQLQVAYHANDMVASLSQTGLPDGSGGTLTKTQTYTLDAADRIRQVTDTTSGVGETRRIVNHYADDSDSPAWIATSTDAGNTWSWERNILTPLGDLGMLQSSQGATSIQLTNPHGDVVATMANDTTSGLTSYGEATEYGIPRDPATAPPRYAWLGAARRSSDTVGGLTLMGARLYNPKTGRFLSPDPVPGGSPNRYLYPTNPVNASDLDGRLWPAIVAALAVRACFRFCAKGAKLAWSAAKRIAKKATDKDSYLFGRGKPWSARKGKLNKGVVRIGWGWYEELQRLVFRIAIGWPKHHQKGRFKRFKRWFGDKHIHPWAR